ncbi:MAG: hypothetical protein CSA95_02480 [Bacteroidetes bacterium]|nr:MAG: hypothetical protein CSA95_02480 [Bacteroidota bacterium]
MFRRTLYLKTTVYLIILILLSGLGMALVMRHASPVFILLTALGILYFSFQLLLSFDKMLRKIAYFFNAIENEDSTLFYSEEVSHKPLRELHKSLNRINLLIKEAKLKNREQEQYLEALLEQISTGIIVFNANGNILQANTAAKKLLKYQTLTHIIQLKRVDETLYTTFASLPQNQRQFISLTHQETTAQLALRATPFVARHKKLTLVSIQDIRNELDAKEVESWQKLIRVLTHEIMNSITPITSLSDTLIGYYTTPAASLSAEARENTIKGLEVIRERGHSLIHFVQSYRRLAKLSPPIFKTIAVKPLIEHILLLMASDAGSIPIRFTHKVTPENLLLNADEGQISQVLINLLQNAIHAVRTVENPAITIVAQQDAEHHIQIAITDNGVGIEEELLSQIFIPFFTTREQGSGIGLSISRQIMHKHNGNIRVVSRPQQGSTFTLEF